jgi:hypothetical protein
MITMNYREVFFAAYGFGPHSCYFCGVVVEGKLVVHHEDHDEHNDDPKNLVACHSGCHVRHHNAEKNAHGVIAHASRMRSLWKDPKYRKKALASLHRRDMQAAGKKGWETRRRNAQNTN